MRRPVLRIRPDGDESVVVLDLYEGDGTTEQPIGVGANPTDAILDARMTLLVALAVIDAVVDDLYAARARRQQDS